ncbi:MAG TPA: GvpL/GvpF family gas vesicle protein [Gaiellaceae bacterium]
MSGEPVPAAADGGTAFYVYGIVSAATDPAAVAGVTGVAGGPVEVVAAPAAAALASVVSLDEFGEEPLRGNLNDRAWLERTARAHDAVLERALEQTPVIPFRLGTIYRGRDQLVDLLSERGASFAALLDRLDGTVELGVKAYLDQSRLLEPTGAGPAAPAQSGREYMLRRKQERDVAAESAQVADECARASHECLVAAALAARANPPQSPELSGRTDQMVLNGAYLVLRGDHALDAAVAKLEEEYGPRGISYEVTGPWPPYNFVPSELAES